jgi:hypothetical protein
MTMDGDPQPLAALDSSQKIGCGVAQLALWNICRHGLHV